MQSFTLPDTNYDDSIAVETCSDSDSDEVRKYENNSDLEPQTSHELMECKATVPPSAYNQNKTDIQVNKSNRVKVGDEYHGNIFCHYFCARNYEFLFVLILLGDVNSTIYHRGNVVYINYGKWKNDTDKEEVKLVNCTEFSAQNGYFHIKIHFFCYRFNLIKLIRKRLFLEKSVKRPTKIEKKRSSFRILVALIGIVIAVAMSAVVAIAVTLQLEKENTEAPLLCELNFH